MLWTPAYLKNRPTNAAQLERWLGAVQCEQISKAMADWYGPDIAVGGVPGAVFARKGGDFVGPIRAGGEATFFDHLITVKRRFDRAIRICSSSRRATLHGFSSLSDLISEMTTGGKRQELWYVKNGTTGVAGKSSSLWGVGTMPQAGGAASAAPGGRACTKSTTGAHNALQNAAGGDTLHFLAANPLCSVAGNVTMLYDRIFDVAKTMSSTATESVTGTPTRYQSTTAGNADYVGGNFLFVETFATLGAGAHNWTVCTYKDEGDAASTMPSLTGNTGNVINQFDHPTGQWFAPLATGDLGIKALTQMQCSASITGTINFVLGHPIAFWPCPVAWLVSPYDGVNTAFSLARIFDDACLAFLEVTKISTSAASHFGSIVLCSG